MAEISGFFPSVSGDRKYRSDFLAKREAAIISNGIYNGELGVAAPGNGMSVTISIGRAWINGYFYGNDAPMLLPVANADGNLDRKDAVVLRWDINKRSIGVQILQGTAASTPKAPPIVRAVEQYDLKIAEIIVAKGTTTITQSMITDCRPDESVCGIVTGAVQQLSTDTYYRQFQAQFDDWFANVKAQLSDSVAGHIQNEIDAQSVRIYSHSKSGGVHALIGAGPNGIFKATADFAMGETFTVNGTAIPAYMPDGDAVSDGLFRAGNWIGFYFDGNRINFKSGGGYGTLAAQINNFYATIGDASVRLTWSNPADGNYAGVVIIRKTGSYPISKSDGVRIYDGTGTSITDTGLINGTQYYYRAFA